MLDPFKYLEITENKIIAKHNCSITIDVDSYDDDSIVNSATQVVVPGILECFIPEFDDYCPIGLNYNVLVQKTQSTHETDEFIVINYEPGDLILHQEYIKAGMDLRFLIRLLHGQIKYISDPKIILNILHNIFPESDLIHLELIISNMIRDKDDITLLARYKNSQENNTVVSIVKQAQVDSTLSSIAFRNISQAIERGLVAGKPIKNNPIEKILQEQFD
jgi:hypothetical protein